jgi:uncharacterized membrane protein (UPF0136 family)
MSLATIVFATIGVASGVGGFMGFKKAGSKASLIAGASSGAALLVAAGLTASGYVVAGLAFGGVTCLALAGRFIPGYLRTRKLMPAGVMAALASGGVLTALLGFLNG